MRTFIDGIIIGALTTLLIILCTLFVNQYINFLPAQNINLSCPVQRHTPTEFELLGILSQRFALNHEYINGTYNCVNYSRDYEYTMNQLGYNVTVQTGYTINYTKGHSWDSVCLYIEPQYGTLIDYSVEYPNEYK